jgi:hypothetical protein
VKSYPQTSQNSASPGFDAWQFGQMAGATDDATGAAVGTGIGAGAGDPDGEPIGSPHVSQ